MAGNFGGIAHLPRSHLPFAFAAAPLNGPAKHQRKSPRNRSIGFLCGPEGAAATNGNGPGIPPRACGNAATHAFVVGSRPADRQPKPPALHGRIRLRLQTLKSPRQRNGRGNACPSDTQHRLQMQCHRLGIQIERSCASQRQAGRIQRQRLHASLPLSYVRPQRQATHIRAARQRRHACRSQRRSHRILKQSLGELSVHHRQADMPRSRSRPARAAYRPRRSIAHRPASARSHHRETPAAPPRATPTSKVRARSAPPAKDRSPHPASARRSSPLRAL